jgi:hypothetical protein
MAMVLIETVLISDGATWIRNMKEELYPDAQQILDYFHLCENISNCAKCVFNNDETKYKPWSNAVCELFKSIKTQEGIKMINGLGKKLLSKSKFNLIGYISNNIDNIDYARYKKEGWYIGSGAIESGNKTVVQQRLKQAGMRWNQDTGQYILSLVSKMRSGLWEKDVVTPVRQKYEPVGAYELIGYPIKKSPVKR